MLTHLPARPRLSTAASHRIVVIASRYNAEFVEPMTEKALAEIAHVEPQSRTEVIHAPGSFEIPFLAAHVIEEKKPDAVICLGVIFQGQTAHADLIAASITETLCRLSVEKLTPVIHGVLLLTDAEQAKARCLGEESNRGIETARAAIEILRTAKSISSR